MPSEQVLPQTWQVAPLSDLTAGDAVTYGVVQPGPNVPSGTPMLRVNNFRGFGLDTSDVLRIAPEIESKYGRTRLRDGDVLITIVGSVGQVAIVPKALEGWNIARAVALVRPKVPSMARWIALFLRSPVAQYALGVAANTTVQTTINLKDLKQLSVPIPPTEELEGIVATLSALDDKIALLRETNSTLEAIAQALFKSWFVDFDPVRAKAEGRDPVGVPPEVADLFPSEFVDSELGEIPKGWRVGAFSDITDVVGGGTPRTKELAYWEGGQHYWATPKDLSGMDTPVLLDTERKITDAGLAKISSGLLPVGTVLMSSRAPIGYLAIAEVPVAVNQGFIAMKPKAGISNLFLLNLLRAQMDEIKSHANGSTFMEISKAAFRPLKVVVPPTPVIQAFDDVARSLYERMVGNVRQMANLTELRDTLLPRLMSGKLKTNSDELPEEMPA